jgi:hypothetical protein
MRMAQFSIVLAPFFRGAPFCAFYALRKATIGRKIRSHGRKTILPQFSQACGPNLRNWGAARLSEKIIT